MVSCGSYCTFMKHVDQKDKPLLDTEDKLLINWLCVGWTDLPQLLCYSLPC